MFVDDDEDAWTVARRVLDQHRALSPACTGGHDTIRVTVQRERRRAQGA